MGNSLLVSCKRIAKRAGLNCGIWKTCIKSGQCEHWYLHRFRATFATRMLQNGMNVSTLQDLRGHSDLSSTMRYLGNLRQKALRAKVDAIWARTEPLAAAKPVTGSCTNWYEQLNVLGRWLDSTDGWPVSSGESVRWLRGLQQSERTLDPLLF